jgi:hypothetical protein
VFDRQSNIWVMDVSREGGGVIGELPLVAEDLQIMGMPAASSEPTTIAELLALPEDGLRHELLDGFLLEQFRPA